MFTEEVRSKVSLSTLAINVDVSTAARIVPAENTPQMGIFPSDFTAKDFIYIVTAGNGDQVEWNIKIDAFIK